MEGSVASCCGPFFVGPPAAANDDWPWKLPSPLAMLRVFGRPQSAALDMEMRQGMAEEKVVYRDGDVEMQGHLVVADAADGPRPLVLVSHTWEGQTDFERAKAKMLSELGYVGFALDNYGGGQTGSTTDENLALMMPLMDDRPALQRRLTAALEAAKGHAAVDASRVAIMGFCFGGLCALDLARTGADLRGAISFDGLFTTDGLPDRGVKAKLLALHGYEDPMVEPEEITAFANEFTKAGADWQLHAYGGTQHAFTNPQAHNDEMGMNYSATAEARAMQSMKNFLAAVFD